jgi:hypothetical protein
MLLLLLHNARAITFLSLEISVAFLAIRRNLFRSLPIFVTYLISIVLMEGIRWGFLVKVGLTSKSYFWAYWLTQAALLSLRGLVVAELCRKILGLHAGIWALCRILLCAIAGVLCAFAAVAAWHNQHHLAALISTLGRDLELAILGTLISAFIFARYYMIRIDRMIALIAAGLVFYSAVQVANNEFVSIFTSEFYPVYAQIVMNSFNITILIWLAAVWKPAKAQVKTDVMLAPQAYGEIMPEVNLRLRELNSRLTEILR